MTPEQLTALVASQALTHRQAIDIYSQTYGRVANAPTLQLPCEQCGKQLPFGDMVSYKVWLPFPGHKDVPGYDEHDQHFACSHDCAEAITLACMRSHLRPEAEQRIQAAQSAAAAARRNRRE